MRATVAAKRHFDSQLELFTGNALRFPIYEATHSIWPDGRTALAGVPSSDGRRIGGEGTAPRDAADGRGPTRTGIGPPAAAIDGPGFESAASPSPGVGNGAGAIHLPAAGVAEPGEAVVVAAPVAAEPEPLRNQSNYRITDADRLGVGSPKQKC